MNLAPLLAAIAIVETGHLPEGQRDAAIGRHGERGRYQLSAAAVADVNRTFRATYDWPADCHDPDYAPDIALLYLTLLADTHYSRTGRAATAEYLARRYNAGSRWRGKQAGEYWQKVKALMTDSEKWITDE